MPWKRLTVTAIIIIPILWLLAFGFSRDARYIPSPLIGHTAPPFTITLFDGKRIHLDDFRGKVVFLNFWASWCLPCRDEARDLEKAWQQFKDKDAVFLGINIQDSDDKALAFLKEFGVTYPNARDSVGTVSIDYGVWGIPETFFIGPEGKITYKHVGALGWPLMTTKLDEARRGFVSAKEGTGSYQSIR